jgi:hypothetical protein
MEKVIPSFQYEYLVLIPKLEILNEEEERGNMNGAGPLGTKIKEEEQIDLEGGKYSPQKEVGGMTYALKQTLEPIESILQEVSY